MCTDILENNANRVLRCYAKSLYFQFCTVLVIFSSFSIFFSNNNQNSIYVCLILCRMFEPLLIGRILAYFSSDVSKTVSLKRAYFYACCLVLSKLITMILYHSTQIEMLHFGMKMRVACCSAIFKKVC